MRPQRSLEDLSYLISYYLPYSHQISPPLNFRGAKIKGSELGTENKGERKLKGVNWSPKFEKIEKF